MSRFTTTLAVAGALALGATAHAQQGPRPMGPPNGVMMGGPGAPGMRGPGGGVASMLLAHTGEFKLSDAQVTRLAAIARRTSDRQRAMRAGMDSMRNTVSAPANPAPGGDVRMGPTPAMRAMAERMRDQEHTELRDAIAILTPEQQALGWEMMMRRNDGGMRAGGAPMRRDVARPGMRRGAGAPRPEGAAPPQARRQMRTPAPAGRPSL